MKRNQSRECDPKGFTSLVEVFMATYWLFVLQEGAIFSSSSRCDDSSLMSLWLPKWIRSHHGLQRAWNSCNTLCHVKMWMRRIGWSSQKGQMPKEFFGHLKRLIFRLAVKLFVFWPAYQQFPKERTTREDNLPNFWLQTSLRNENLCLQCSETLNIIYFHFGILAFYRSGQEFFWDQICIEVRSEFALKLSGETFTRNLPFSSVP